MLKTKWIKKTIFKRWYQFILSFLKLREKGIGCNKKAPKTCILNSKQHLLKINNIIIL